MTDRRNPHGYLRGAVEALHDKARAEFEEMKRVHAEELEHAERQILALRRIVAEQRELLDQADLAVGEEGP